MSLKSVARSSVRRVTRARLRFPSGDPIEVDLDEVAAYGPEITGFRAWLGAVSASDQGRWVIRFADETVLGFQRGELKRIRLTPTGADITLGSEVAPRTLTVRVEGSQQLTLAAGRKLDTWVVTQAGVRDFGITWWVEKRTRDVVASDCK